MATEDNRSEPEKPSGISAGVGWLLIDMTVVTGMTVLVKASSTSYPAFQLVFIRALIGLVLIIPLIWKHRHELRRPKKPWRNVSRITCNAVALTSNFLALGMLPLALVNAVGFSRPIIVMALAIFLLSEKISRLRWLGAGLAFCGILLMFSPGGLVWNAGLIAVFASVFFGALATIQTRMLHDENTTVMMVFYTVGLVIITAGPALFVWHPVEKADWLPLLGIGILAQIGQYCWLRAYQKTDASLLAPVGYLSVVFATIAGYLFFAEVPQPRVMIGVGIILIALQGTALLERYLNRRRRLAGDA